MPQRTIGHIADELIRKHPDHPAKSLARTLVKKANQAITIEQARSMLRYRLGQCGKKHREKPGRGLRRKARRPGDGVAMPSTQAVPWVPYRLDVVGRVGILSDIHCPYHSEIAVRAAVGHFHDGGIDALLLNGDIADFYAISRWIKDPSQRDFRGELEAVRNFVAWLRQEFPKIPIVYKAGNHEERWQHWLWQHAPEISDEPMMSLSAWLHLDRHGIELVEDQRPVMVGLLPVLHGHELPKGLAAPVNVARGAFLRTLSTVLVGHSHRSSGHAESDMWHNEIFTWSAGCLCDLTPEYARINRWNWGAAIVDVAKDGEFGVQNFRISGDGKVRAS